MNVTPIKNRKCRACESLKTECKCIYENVYFKELLEENIKLKLIIDDIKNELTKYVLLYANEKGLMESKEE